MATRTDRSRSVLTDEKGQQHNVRIETQMLERWSSNAGIRTLAETSIVKRDVSLDETSEALVCRDGLWMTEDGRLTFPGASLDQSDQS